jgi:2'-5' RNA ligase
VALLFDAHTTAELDGLRRALGDDLGRIPPHLTLVPPVNVRDVDRAEEVLRAAGRASRPLELMLGPVATFLPHNPVAYLGVGGDVEGVVALRDGVVQPPLARELTWPYVPHVTIVDGAPHDRVEAARLHLGAYRISTTVRSVHLLEELDHRWEPRAVLPLGPPVVIGTGGAPLELEVIGAGTDVTVRARRDHADVGEARAWVRGTVAWLSHVAVVESARRDGIGRHLLAAVQSWCADRGALVIEADASVAVPDEVRALLEAMGWRAEPRLGRHL